LMFSKGSLMFDALLLEGSMFILLATAPFREGLLSVFIDLHSLRHYHKILFKNILSVCLTIGIIQKNIGHHYQDQMINSQSIWVFGHVRAVFLSPGMNSSQSTHRNKEISTKC
jgi:hypothetical protein